MEAAAFCVFLRLHVPDLRIFLGVFHGVLGLLVDGLKILGGTSKAFAPGDRTVGARMRFVTLAQFTGVHVLTGIHVLTGVHMLTGVNVLTSVNVLTEAAFGVFGWFEVTNFDVFLCFSHIITFLLIRVCCLCWIARTEQELTPANDILFGYEIVETDQSFLPALWPMTH